MSLSVDARPSPGATRARSGPIPQLVSSSRPLGAADIVMPRPAALLAAGGVFCLVSAALTVAEHRSDAAATLQVLLPLIIGVAAVGVGRLASWLPQVWAEWRGWVGYAALAPAAALLLVAVIVPQSSWPWWSAPAAGAFAALPFVVSAFGPGRLRQRWEAQPDAFGDRGGLLASGALLVSTVAALRPEYGWFEVMLPVVLAGAALSSRGLADAGAGWGVGRWSAFGWGALVVWASQIASAVAADVDAASGRLAPWPTGLPPFAALAVALAIAVVGALPLALASRPRRPHSP